MVGIPQEIATPANRRRLAAIMREVGFPGENQDHIWIARRLEAFACKLNQGTPSDYLEDLLLSAILMERGFDPAEAPQLAGRCFPDQWLRAVPRLLKIGCPESSWRLIESGILRFDGDGFGHAHRWCIEGQHLQTCFLEWYEMAESLVFKNLARGLAPLIQDSSRQAEIKITGTSRQTGRQWLRELKSALHALGADPSPHRLVIG
jgi:hypothetical protein